MTVFTIGVVLFCIWSIVCWLMLTRAIDRLEKSVRNLEADVNTLVGEANES